MKRLSIMNMKLLGSLCSLCLALGFVVRTDCASFLFFGEPEFPKADNE